MESKKSKKNPGINKGKMKRTIKNVLCRPDPLFWPNVSQEHTDILESALKQYKIVIPEFNKPNWNDIKHLPKTERPRPPKIEKVTGLIFGMNHCKNAINDNDCSVILIESAVNPRAIVQPLVDTCVSNRIPILCVNGLKKITATYFGIPTSCLGLQHNCIEELKNKILNVAESYKPQKTPLTKVEDNEKMEIEDTKCEEPCREVCSESPYLYRDSKKTRVFNPSSTEGKTSKAFIGQDFIKLTENTQQKSDRKAYMTMILKRIANNQNRGKKKDGN